MDNDGDKQDVVVLIVTILAAGVIYAIAWYVFKAIFLGGTQ